MFFMEYEKCKRCKKNWLIYQDEKDFGVCEPCADESYQKYLERKEWEVLPQ
jgi:hypothetical protein